MERKPVHHKMISYSPALARNDFTLDVAYSPLLKVFMFNLCNCINNIFVCYHGYTLCVALQNT